MYPEMTNLLHSPSVVVKPISRTNPIVEKALDEIKAIVKEDGFADVNEYRGIAEAYKLPDEILLPGLQQKGYGFVKSQVYATQPEQEVIVDLRYMAAMMLLIYSDDQFAFHNSVLDYLKASHTVATWKAAFPIAHSLRLLEDTYSQYGHHFTDMEMANAADLVHGSLNHINRMAERHMHALHELSTHELALTNVYHLALQTFRALNDPERKPGDNTSVVHRIVYQKREKPAPHDAVWGHNGGYPHFWRLAMKILDVNRPERTTGLMFARMKGDTHEA